MNEWWLYSDRAVLRQEDGLFPLSDDQTTVDFTSQTRFTGDTNPNGNEVAIYGLEPNAWGVQAIHISGNECVVIGLDRVMQRGHGVAIAGNNNRVIGCTISGPLYSGVYISGGFGGPAPSGNVVGGTQPGEGNELSAGNHGVRIDTPAEHNVVIGNYLTGVFAGVAVRGNPYTGSPVGNRIGGPTPEERNVISGAGKYGEEGYPDGAQVALVMAVDTLIEGNYIGTTADGTAPASPQRGPAGVEVRDSTGTVIRGNVIGGIRVPGANHYAGQLFGAGVFVSAMNDNTFDTTIEGNIIGADPTGQFPVPNLYGVNVSPFTARTLPYGTHVASNLIAFNERAGVRVQSLVTEVTITANSIIDNGELGIDLLTNTASPGVNPNDPGDGDSGGNGLQNFPVVTSAASQGASTRVQGTFNSKPNGAYVLEFFASAACDPSGHGEGERFLGSIEVATDSQGDAAFDALLGTATQPGDMVTATATDAVGNTSEFSACIEVGQGRLVGDTNCDGAVDAFDVEPFILALTDPNGYVTQFPNCDIASADANGDGVVDAFDIEPFIALLFNP
jgi:hypothetical protein